MKAKRPKDKSFPSCRGWLSLSEAQAYAGVGKDALKAWRESGLKWARIGGLVRIKKSDIDAFLQAHYDREMEDIDALVEGIKL